MHKLILQISKKISVSRKIGSRLFADQHKWARRQTYGNKDRRDFNTEWCDTLIQVLSSNKCHTSPVYLGIPNWGPIEREKIDYSHLKADYNQFQTSIGHLNSRKTTDLHPCLLCPKATYHPTKTLASRRTRLLVSMACSHTERMVMRVTSRGNCSSPLDLWCCDGLGPFASKITAS